MAPLPQSCSARRCRAPAAPRGSSRGAVTAVSEVALGSCRCTCAGSPGPCGRARTAPCSPGSSATWPQCCKAGHGGRQVRDSRDCSPAPLNTPTASPGRAEGLCLEQLWQLQPHLITDLPPPALQSLQPLWAGCFTPVLLISCLAEMLFHPHQISLQSHVCTFFPR